MLILAAAITGLRQSELLGLRWRDVDWRARRLRVRNAFVRGEHSGEGKSDLSTRRSVPLHDRLYDALATWRTRTVFADRGDLVFAHPELGSPLDRTKVTRRFKKACRDAGVQEIRFHDLRHTFATQLAASGTPMRTLQEFLGQPSAVTQSRASRSAAPGPPEATAIAVVELPMLEQVRVLRGPARVRDLAGHRSL